MREMAFVRNVKVNLLLFHQRHLHGLVEVPIDERVSELANEQVIFTVLTDAA